MPKSRAGSSKSKSGKRGRNQYTAEQAALGSGDYTGGVSLAGRPGTKRQRTTMGAAAILQQQVSIKSRMPRIIDPADGALVKQAKEALTLPEPGKGQKLLDLQARMEELYDEYRLNQDEEDQLTALREKMFHSTKVHVARTQWVDRFTTDQLRRGLEGEWFSEDQIDLVKRKLQLHLQDDAGNDVSAAKYNTFAFPVEVFNEGEKKHFESLTCKQQIWRVWREAYRTFYKELFAENAHLGEVDKQDRAGKTPLHNAVVDQDAAAVERNILQGAKVQTFDYAGWSPLHDAGNIQIAGLLLAAGADPSMCCAGEHGNTPLHEAAMYGNIGVLKLMLKFGADVTTKNRYFEEALDVVKPDAQDVKDILRQYSHDGGKRCKKGESEPSLQPQPDGDWPWMCQGCKKRFSRKGGLTSHMRTCRMCEQAYPKDEPE